MIEHINAHEPHISLERTRKHDVRCPFDREKVQQTLEDILADQHSVPVSMREVARRLGYPVRTIKQYFPMLCRQIARRFIEYRKQQGQLRKTHLRQRIYEAAHIVHDQRLTPTCHRVGKVLNSPGCFREREARYALLDIRSQLDRETAGEHVAEMERSFKQS